MFLVFYYYFSHTLCNLTGTYFHRGAIAKQISVDIIVYDTAQFVRFVLLSSSQMLSTHSSIIWLKLWSKYMFALE